MHLQTPETFDAVVVGSGISGGWAAKELTEHGLRTLVLERGRDLVHGPGAYANEHKSPWEFAHRNRGVGPAQSPTQRVQSRIPWMDEAALPLYQDDTEHPYVEEAPFTWIQGRTVGGRSLLWGRHCYRMSDLDFEANLRDGHGVDWPIRYADLAPWYSHVERFAGVSGEALGLAHLPDGEFQPPMALNAGEVHLRDAIATQFPGRHLTIGRVAVLTQAIGDRKACHYCGPCERGCSTGSYFSSNSSTLPAAQRTGRLTLRSRAMAHSVMYDDARGRASGVRYVDLESGELREVRARVVFLCASTLGTTRVMLNSTSSRFPNGIANDSGALGHYLMDHHYQLGAAGEIPGLLDRYYEGNRPTGYYIPRYRNLGGPDSDRLGYVRGFGHQGSVGREGWHRGATMRGIGADLKSRLHDPGPWHAYIGAWGETLPREDNYALLDPKQTDRWGVPLLRVKCTWGPNELAMRKDALAQAAAMLEAAGCRGITTHDNHSSDGYGAEPGLCIHEMGTARMGRDPRTSVLDGNNRAHAVPNLYVTDGACMTSSACQNPSVTYMALTARAVGHAVGEVNRREL
ncbi:MAG: GMC family oxidoreductase [Gemmatimonadaceae bacterium]|nr:GMC family oxidoreductase [Gemmatimonadaceae bacterium]